MSLSSRMRTWWRAVRHEYAVDAQIDHELRFHIESCAEDLMRGGVPREEAMRRAKAQLGSLAAARENSRQAWGTRWVDDLRGDLRYAVRMLAKSPGFALIAVGSLALGIGANTVIFTAAQHALLDRLDVPHPEQLRLLEWAEPKDGVVSEMWGFWDDLAGGGEVSTSFSYPVYQQLRQENRSLADIFAFKNIGPMTATIDGQAEVVQAEMVSGNYYSTLEVQPQLGRVIQESDDGEVGSGPVVVISDAYWAKRFGRSPDIAGKRIVVNATPMTIVGVNPPGFTGAYSAQESPDIFVPFSMQPIVAPKQLGSDRAESLLQNKTLWWVLMMGRIKPGVPIATAQAALNVQLSAAVRGTMPVKNDKQIPRLMLTDGSRGQNPNAEGLTKPLEVLLGLAGFVLLLACANLATLLLARAGARQREMCVRLALGAGQVRILRQVMTESLLLSLMGGGTGLLFAAGVNQAVPRLMSSAWTPPAFRASLNWHIFGFAAAMSVVTALIFGVLPALHATRVHVSSGLKDAAQTVTHRRRGLAGRSIVVLQVALSMLLVVGAGLFVQTLMRLEQTPLGFRSRNLLLFDVDLPPARYPGTAALPVLQQIEAKVAALPGVDAETLTRIPLISGNAAGYTVVPEGHLRRANSDPSSLMNDVGQDFFSTFRIPILEGRPFNAGDTTTSQRVAVVNESFARKFFPDLNPLGRTFLAGRNHPVSMRIVGVCGDAKYYTMRRAPQPTFYEPYEQQTADVISHATFAVATRVSGSSLLPSIRDAVQSVDRNLPILNVRTQDEQVADNLRQERIFADLTGAFGVLALVLACIGIYGITAYSVSQRTNEIGIRMALGAEPGRVLRMVLREASWLGLLGVVAGLAGALALGRVIGAMLYGLKPWDPATLGASAVLLLVVALAAGWVPARRAAGVDPMRALRHE
ncbi:MAG TPA: ABC transporter permease [Acidobacteriaceae bacterium]|nr:ABC transporter permease [Acidobacteriaceae bacterium]